MKLSFGARIAKILLSVRVGFFLAYRELKRSNIWSTILIIAVMILTFLNLVVVAGVLLGLIEGASSAVKKVYTSDVFISTLQDKSYIEQSSKIVSYLEHMPEVKAFAPRYVESGTLEANYKEARKPNEQINTAGGLVTGIDPDAEDGVSGLSSKIIEGSYLKSTDFDQIMVGAYLLDKYLPLDTPGFKTLRNVGIGSKVRLKLGNVTREMTIKGIVKTKVDEMDMRIYMVDSQMRSMIGRNDFNVDEIAIKLIDPMNAATVVTRLKSQGFDTQARIKTWQDAQPKFIEDMQKTFAILGNVIGSIGLVAGSITIFIVVFVNAITRRRYIGILKGIGINSLAIEMSYIMQALFYAVIGMILGSILILLILKPYFIAHPINFPFSDGILVATVPGLLWRAALLTIATIIAGYIPARIVVKQNTLDAILGR